ncbi:hypothetical protein GCM10011607_12180 [Shewanella inventionis]|uniref:Uncharacterized protein n=1 Tax=Shewanella inventionis TaxID=1738770 RepID=A0ABQ1IV42_9GAMM|nr:hypothetical protein [Shewanella inventionis]GGB53221.1 hypothetical protein GCM10011607_12180 [Shewanella inventionis]
MNALEIKTREEIEDLKRDWKNDPCWDIENTEGFEVHKNELKAYSDECELEWSKTAEKRKARENKKLEEELERIGALGMLKMIKALKSRLNEAEERIYNLENPNG